MAQDLNVSEPLLTLPDGSKVNLNNLPDDELLELYHSYNSDPTNCDTPVGTLVGGGFVRTFQCCVGPTSRETMGITAKLFLLCLILRVITLVKFPTKVKHIASCLCGIGAFLVFFSEHPILPQLILLCGAGYGLMFLTVKYRGVLASLFCVAHLLACELFVVGAETWLTVKGSFMILSMKIISIAFDVDQGTIGANPHIIDYYGYVLCPSSIIFGPFMMYKDYCQILKSPPMSMSWLLSIARAIVLGYIFLIFSSCICPWLFPEDSNKWLLAYQTAMSFRFSNYFVGYFSECACLLCGIGTVLMEDKGESIVWKVPTSRPLHVELPRSYAEIAIHWGVPNHVFLKNYVFKKARPLGPFVAILFTFAASSILHGLSFQVAAVLLSIGTYAYVEYAFRKKLARILKMCIESRRCRSDCQHIHKEGNYWVTVINLGFGFLNIFHLAYLGAMFDGDHSMDRGFGAEYTLKTWSGLNYLSHWVVLATYLISVLL